MNNMPYPFIPDINMMNPSFSYNQNHPNNTVAQLEEQIHRLNRDMRRLEHRVNLLEKKNQPHISKTSMDDHDDSGIYMM